MRISVSHVLVYVMGGGIGVKVAGVGSRDFSVIGVGAGVEVMNFLATVVGVGIGVRTLVWSRSDWTD